MTRNDGEQRSVSRREVLKFAGSAPVLLSLGPIAATLGAQKASAADMRLIDFAERLVPPDQIKSAGFDGVLVYVSELRPGATFDFKPVTREYADALRALGLSVVLLGGLAPLQAGLVRRDATVTGRKGPGAPGHRPAAETAVSPGARTT